MRSRDEVLKAFGISAAQFAGDYELKMADHIAAVEKQRDEYHRLYTAEVLAGRKLADRIRELEARQVASEPVAWAIVNRDGVTMDVRMTWAEAREHSIGGDTLRPLVFGDVAHPSAAAVRDAALEAAAAAFYHEQYGAQGGRYELVNPRHRHVWRDKARAVLTAALTAASEGASA